MMRWDDADVVLLDRVRAHEIANLVQVVDGWLQLGDMAEARAALAEAADAYTRSRAMKACPASLAAELIVAAAEAGAVGVAWHLEMDADDAPLDPLADGDRAELRALLSACREAAASAAEPALRVVVRSRRGRASVACHITGELPRDRIERLSRHGETAAAPSGEPARVCVTWHARGT